MAKTILSTTTNYLYDGANPVQELSGTTPTGNMLTGGIDEYFTRTDSTGTGNFLTDALGSTLSLTNSSGGTVASYSYEPFGNTTISGSSTNTYQYTGRENDGTGVYFYRARYYSPTLQRFVSEDPFGLKGGDVNLFAHTGDNPINFRDSRGLSRDCFLPICGGFPKLPPPPLPPLPVAGRKPKDAAKQYCEDNGGFSFHIPWTNIPVTVDTSSTLGPANYSSTNDLNTLVPLIPWPEWLAGGASLDITINAPEQPSNNVSVGLGKNLSVGYFPTANGPQGISLSLGPSIGPPINLSHPTNNVCGMVN